MKDSEIIELYFARSEDAITETDKKHGSFCRSVTFGILGSREDSEECVNDTYLALWNHIPPDEPENLPAYMIQILKNRARDRLRAQNALKRSAENVELSDVLSSSIPNPSLNTEEDAILAASDVLNRFLRGLPKEKRILFVLRFWYEKSIEEIAETLGFSVAKTTKTLYRLKDAFKKALREGS